MREMHIHKVPFVDGMCVGRSTLASSTEEFATYQTGVNVCGGFEGDGARVVGGVKVQEGAVDGVEIGAGGRRRRRCC